MPAETAPKATIGFVPRETFTPTQASLETLLDATSGPYRLVCIDGGSPPAVRDFLADAARRHDFTLVRTEHLLAPNEARNMVMDHVDTEYVVYVDNDCLVSPGWLSALVACADETGADAVAPVYLIGRLENGHVHAAGSVCRLDDVGGRRLFVEHPLHLHARLDDLRRDLERQETGSTEFHCVLFRASTLREVGLLDERLLSDRDHGDIALRIKERGGSIWLEPGAVVSYAPPARLTVADRLFFLLRWSERWNRASHDHFRAKWDLAADDPSYLQGIRWTRKHRFLVWPRYPSGLRWLSRRFGWVHRPLPDRIFEPLARVTGERRRARGGVPAVVHVASWATAPAGAGRPV